MGAGRHEKRHNKNVEWYTPPSMVASLGEFDLDPCAPMNPERQLPMLVHWTKEDDGLSQPWAGRVWCNPPYGGHVGEWLARCADHKNAIVLVFARTETEWFHQHVWLRATAILFLKGRIRFLDHEGIARHGSGAPSVLIAYSQENGMALIRSGQDGRFFWLR